MKYISIHVTGIVCAGILFLACTQVNSVSHVSNSTNQVSLSAAPDDLGESARVISAKDLCEKLREIRKIPYDPTERTGDTVFDGLMSAGNDAVPCLIEKITDVEKIDDPVEAPKVSDFRVGDAAVYMLMYITKQSWKPEEMFPPKYARMFKSEGVYAYFAFVENPSNRKKIQDWWKNWAMKNLVENS